MQMGKKKSIKILSSCQRPSVGQCDRKELLGVPDPRGVCAFSRLIPLNPKKEWGQMGHWRESQQSRGSEGKRILFGSFSDSFSHKEQQLLVTEVGSKLGLPTKVHVKYPLLMEKEGEKLSTPWEEAGSLSHTHNPSATLLKTPSTGRKAGTLLSRYTTNTRQLGCPEERWQKHSKNSTPEAQAHEAYLGLSLERAREQWKQGSQLGC